MKAALLFTGGLCAGAAIVLGLELYLLEFGG